MKVKYQRKIQRGHAGQPNPPMQPTPLRVNKIGPIFSGRISYNGCSIYEGGAADGHSVRRS